MTDDRYRHQRPLWALISGAESIMPPTHRDETLSADDLTVTVHAGAVMAVLLLPFGLTADPAGSIAATVLAAACVKAARGTHVTYRRVRQRTGNQGLTGPTDIP